ncbi:hypothetical protein MTO96_032513 [Rhipicephalus appendiculatus]
MVYSTEPAISVVAVGYEDVVIASVNEPQIHIETLAEPGVTMVSLSDPDVTMRSVSEDAAVMPVSVSLTCIKCHSQLGLQISGASNTGLAERAGAIGFLPFAQTRPGLCEQPQGFSVASPCAASPASSVMQISGVAPDSQLQPPTTLSQTPLTVQPFATGTASAVWGYATPISDTSTMGQCRCVKYLRASNNHYPYSRGRQTQHICRQVGLCTAS